MHMADTTLPVSTPPRPEQRPETLTLFGDTRVDEYAWLRDADSPEVVAHLEAENAHTEAWFAARTGELREQLFAELRGRIDERDHSVPVREGEWFYWARTEEGDEHARHCRLHVPERDAAPPDPRDAAEGEQLFLDENALAEPHEFFDLATYATSPDQRWCAWLDDVEGDETYGLRLRSLPAAGPVDTPIITLAHGCGPTLAWVDASTIVYTRLDASHRPYQIWRHRLGSDPAEDLLLLDEADPKFYASVFRMRSDAFVAISLDSQISSEMWLIACDSPLDPPRCVQAREQGVEYALEHVDDRVFMLTNRGARNFRVQVAALARLDEWHDFVPPREHVLIEDVDVFRTHVVVWERAEGLQRIRVIPFESSEAEHYVEFLDPTYSIWASSNPDIGATTLRFVYSSLTTPTSTFDYDLVARTRVLRKQEVVVGGHDASEYSSERMWATAPDGARIPISLVWRGERPSEARPLLLYGYGAYGMSYDPSFSSNRLSLLRRGVVWGIAHVRGGAELGRDWYEQGKLGNKPNTFTDFVACAEQLIAAGWTRPAQLAISGGSAGGLLIGAVLNLRPELFRVAIAEVPFVDALSTMLDETLPLSMIEREEWGDPTTPEGYAWLRSYAPYDNLRSAAYGNVLALAGFHDTRVGYWEAAKWMARMRERATGAGERLLWVSMHVGHAGPSGRFEALRDLALEYAFLIERLGVS